MVGAESHSEAAARWQSSRDSLVGCIVMVSFTEDLKEMRPWSGASGGRGSRWGKGSMVGM